MRLRARAHNTAEANRRPYAFAPIMFHSASRRSPQHCPEIHGWSKESRLRVVPAGTRRSGTLLWAGSRTITTVTVAVFLKMHLPCYSLRHAVKGAAHMLKGLLGDSVPKHNMAWRACWEASQKCVYLQAVHDGPCC